MISDIISNSEHSKYTLTHPPECQTPHYKYHVTIDHNNIHNIIQPHDMTQNKRTQLRSSSHNHNNHTRTKYKLQLNRHTFTTYRKSTWTQFTSYTETPFSDIQQTANIHCKHHLHKDNSPPTQTQKRMIHSR